MARTLARGAIPRPVGMHFANPSGVVAIFTSLGHDAGHPLKAAYTFPVFGMGGAGSSSGGASSAAGTSIDDRSTWTAARIHRAAISSKI